MRIAASRTCWLWKVLALAALCGCGGQDSKPANGSTAKTKQPVAGQPSKPGTIPYGRVALGRNVYLETTRDMPEVVSQMVGGAFLSAGLGQSGIGLESGLLQQPFGFHVEAPAVARRVVIPATVCLRTGYLEHLLGNGAKAHESVIFADVDARYVHFGLVALGAQPGKVVQYRNADGKDDFRPPSGDKIRVLVEYFDVEQWKRVQVPAQKWIREAKSKKELRFDWVFSGSQFLEDPDGKPTYAANEGRFICVTNFWNALLDLPIRSQDADPQAGLDFEVNTDAVPPLGTPVTVYLELMPKE